MPFSKKNQAAKQDFTENMLPVNRRQMFFDCIKQRFDIIFKCGLILLIFILPLLIVDYWGNLAYADLVSDTEASDVAGTAAAMQQIISLIKIPCYVILGIGFSAISRILRQLVWAEHIFFFEHLKLGVRQNCKSFLVIFLIYGILNAINTFVSTTFAESFFSGIPPAISLLIFIPVGIYMLSQSIIYNVTFGKSFKNGLTLYLKTAPFVWIFVALIFAFSLTNGIGILLVKIPVHLVIILFVVPMFSIAWILYSFHVFDKYVNPENHPEIIGKGLYRPIESEIKSE